MPLFLFTDNARATLAAPIGPATTTITLSSGGGQHFPQPVTGAVFALTFNDNATGTVYETCYCTSRTGDTLVIQRGQEGSVAQSWTIGDFVFHGPTSGQQQNFVQYPHMTDASIAPVFSNTVVQGNEQVTGLLTVGNGTTSFNGLTASGYDANGASWRVVGGNYGTIFRNDGANAYFLQTASGSPYGTWNAYRPFYWSLGNGAVTIDATGAGVNFGGSTVTAANSTVRGISFFGTTGAFYAGPNGSSSLLNFASNQYIQFTPGTGFVFVSSGAIYLEASSGTISTTTITSQQNLSANGSVTAGQNVTASGAVTATGNVSAGQSVTAGINVIATQNVIADATVTGVLVTARGPAGGGQPGMNMGYDGQSQPYISFIANSHFLQQLGTNWWYWLNSSGNPTMTLAENGLLTTFGYATFSDERIKDDIAPFERGLETVLKIEPISFRYNGQGGVVDDGKLRYGFSAQQVRDHLPEAVTEVPAPPPMPEGQQAIDGLLQVDDRPVLLAVVNAIKELAAQVVQLTARIETLEARL